MRDLRFRAIGEADLAELADLWVAIWRLTLPEIDFESRRGWFIGHIRGLIAGGADGFVACEADDRALGFAVLDRRSGYLDQISVREDAQGTPVARDVMAEVKRRSPGVVTLSVNQDNPRAIRFYEREGFVIVSEGVNPKSGLRTWGMRWAAHDAPARDREDRAPTK